MTDTIHLLMEARWEGDIIRAAFLDKATANRNLKNLKCHAAQHRVEPEMLHELETNLYVCSVPIQTADTLLHPSVVGLGVDR